MLTDFYALPLSSLPRRPLLQVPPELSCADAISALRRAGSEALLLCDPAYPQRPLGIVTQQDIVFSYSLNPRPSAPISSIATSPVVVASDDDVLFEAIGTMQRLGLRHLPILPRAGGDLWLLTLQDALQLSIPAQVSRTNRFLADKSLEGCIHTKRQQPELAQELLDQNLSAASILSALSHINRDLHESALNIAIDRVASEQGPCPAPFSMLFMGSGGRGESLLFPDQDNAFIIDDMPSDEDHDGSPHAEWFAAVASEFTQLLAEIGFTLCKGDVMATNPIWTGRRGEWHVRVLEWFANPSPQVVLNADIFLDFAYGAGPRDLVEELRDVVTDALRRSPHFLRNMYLHVPMSKSTPVDWGLGAALARFISTGRLSVGAVDMKRHGTFPLVYGIRVLSLRAGCRHTSTVARIDHLHSAGILGDYFAEDCKQALETFQLFCLRRQVASALAGEIGDYVINPRADLTRREQARLRDAFAVVSSLASEVHAAFTQELL